MKISIPQLAVEADQASRTIDAELAPHICRACRLPASCLRGYQILRRSIDARSKPRVKLLYRLEVTLEEQALPAAADLSSFSASQQEPPWEPPACPPEWRGRTVLVAGAGPAGLFAALCLARQGVRPIVLERGESVEQRALDIQLFREQRHLKENSNYLFGEGGAGTWSDGKLFTRVNDPRVSYVLQQFIACGAPPAIGYFSHPHIGSDRLPQLVANLRRQIIGLGGEFHWGCCVESLLLRQGECRGVVLTSGERLEGDATLIACGHSARPLLLKLVQQGVQCQLKGFQLGMRIEHPQTFINAMQFGVPDSYPALGAAEYSVLARPAAGQSSGVTSFCMCPGGEIIPAVSAAGCLCTNGMSNADRSGRWANAAIITSIEGSDFASPRQAYDFLEKLESSCFCRGGGDYTAPAQTAADFLTGKNSSALPDSSYCLGTVPARLDLLLPDYVTARLRQALRHFDRIHPGFLANGTFIGLETRVSSPIRFLRQPQTESSSLPGLYLSGEGAGMAGGITSAAVDGLKMAEAILRRQL